MSRSVNIYELMHEFWKENDYKPFPSSVTALFFFLLDRANSRHWKMPLKCPTSLICRAINVSKQTALAAREALLERGLLIFDKGTGKDRLPSYIIVTDLEKWTDSWTDYQTEDLTEDLTPDHTDSLPLYKRQYPTSFRSISPVSTSASDTVRTVNGKLDTNPDMMILPP